jgi:hypothetical protein
MYKMFYNYTILSEQSGILGARIRDIGQKWRPTPTHNRRKRVKNKLKMIEVVETSTIMGVLYKEDIVQHIGKALFEQSR